VSTRTAASEIGRFRNGNLCGALADAFVHLSDATFAPPYPGGFRRGNLFDGSVRDEGVRFWLSDLGDYGSNRNLAEQLPDGTHLVVAGQVTARPTATGLAGPLDGDFVVYDRDFYQAVARCRSATHGFTLSR
jgi:hypothetical protein